MAEIKSYWSNAPKFARILFWVLLFIGAGFVIGSFFIPPMGVIDSSVLAAFGEMQGFASLGVGFECVYLGMEVKLQKGDTEIIVHQQHDENNNVEEQ